MHYLIVGRIQECLVTETNLPPGYADMPISHSTSELEVMHGASA